MKEKFLSERNHFKGKCNTMQRDIQRFLDLMTSEKENNVKKEEEEKECIQNEKKNKTKNEKMNSHNQVTLFFMNQKLNVNEQGKIVLSKLKRWGKTLKSKTSKRFSKFKEFNALCIAGTGPEDESYDFDTVEELKMTIQDKSDYIQTLKETIDNLTSQTTTKSTF